MSIGFALTAVLASPMPAPFSDGIHALKPVNLRCENFAGSTVVDASSPRLSWILQGTGSARDRHQTAYQVLVATSKERLASGRVDLWDSGKVLSRRQNQVVYEGKPLRSWQTCYWKVRAWEGDVRGPWSPSSHWEMGLLEKGEWRGVWIDDGRESPKTDAEHYADDPAPLFRKPFVIRKPVTRARLAISGLGYYEASINGAKVGDHVLDPGWTRYDKRVGYAVFDVTKLIRSNQNCMGIRLGNGWFNPLPLRLFGSFDLRARLPVGRPRVIAQLRLEFKDGSTQTVASDSSWKVGGSGMLRNNVYLGEVVDARLEPVGWDEPGFDDAAWRPSNPSRSHVGPLLAPTSPPIRITKRWHAVKVTQPQKRTYIYDLGVNFAGWASFELNVPRGSSLRFRYGELLHPDGTLNPMTSVAGQIKGFKEGTTESVGGPGAPKIAWQEDLYIAKGGGETYTPRFTFHGFRYVEITGLAKALPLSSVTGLRLNSDVGSVGKFSCSNRLLNTIQSMCERTFRSNIFSVQSDCPHRERLGYGGDIVATSEAFMSNFDMSGFYQKSVRDWTDSALDDGMFTDTAPFIGIQYCGLIWAMAQPLLTDQLYRHYGDRRLSREQYAAAKRWLGLLQVKYPSGVVSDGLSDHEGLAEAPPEALVTPMYFASANLLARQAARVGNKPDEARFGALASQIRDAYCAKFIDPISGKVGPGTQTSQSLALATGIVPDSMRPKVEDILVKEIERQNRHLTTGILGTRAMLAELSRMGRIDLAYAIATQYDFPSWGWMLKNGATTLWEHWEFSNNTFSHNHPMFGSISEWMMQWLGGIQPDTDADGFDRIVISPKTPRGLDWVASSHESIRGRIASSWRRQGHRVNFELTIPINCRARVILPAPTSQCITEGGTTLARVRGVSDVRMARGGVEFAIGSGSYIFTVNPD